MSEKTNAGTASGSDTAETLADLESLGGEIDGGGDFVPAADQPAPEPEPESIPTAELVAPLVGLFCATVAPAWNIGPVEQEQLAGVYAAVIDKYFPGGVPMGPEVGAVMVTAAIVVPRLGQPLKLAAKEAGDDGEKSEHGAPE